MTTNAPTREEQMTKAERDMWREFARHNHSVLIDQEHLLLFLDALDAAEERERVLRCAISAYLQALDTISDANDRGRDDSGKRPTDTYAQWLGKDCAYTEALAALRAALAATKGES
jgi:hypothetical protein